MANHAAPPQPDPEDDVLPEDEAPQTTTLFGVTQEVELTAVVDPRKPPGT